MAEFPLSTLALPLSHNIADIGVVMDAAGATVFTIDVNNQHPDADVTALAELLVEALNTSPVLLAREVANG